MTVHAHSNLSRLVPKTGPRRRVAQALEAGLKGRRPALYAARLASALPAAIEAPPGETLWRSALIGPARYPSGSRDAVILAGGRLIPAVVRQRHRDGNVHADPIREIRRAVAGAPGQDRAQRPLVPPLEVDSAWLREAARRHDIPLNPSLTADLIQAVHAACAAARTAFRATLDPEVAWLLKDDSDLERFHNWLCDDRLADEIVRRRQAAFAELGHGCEHIRSRDAVAQRLDAGEDPFRLLGEVLDAAPDALKRLALQPQALASLEEAQRKAWALELMPPGVLKELSGNLDIAGGWAARAMSLASLTFSDPAQRRDAARRLLSRPGLRRFVDYPARFDDWSFDEGTKEFAGLLSAVVRFGLLPPVMLEAAGGARDVPSAGQITTAESMLAQAISRSAGIMAVELARLQWRKLEPWLAKNLVAACHPSRHSWPSLITHQTDRTHIDCLATQDELEELGARLMLGPTILHDILVEGHHVLRRRDKSERTVAITAVRQADLEAAARRRRVDERDTKRDGWAVNAQWKRLMPVEVARLIDRIAKRKVKVRLSHVRRQINRRAAAAARLRAMPCGFDAANADARGLAEAALAPIMRLLVRNPSHVTDKLFGPPLDPELEADAAFLQGRRRPGRRRKRAMAPPNPATNVDDLSPLLRPTPEAVVDVPATYSPAAAAERIKRSIIRGKPAVPKDPMKARFVAIDVETTGLDEADRIVEIAAVELVGPRATGRTYEVLVDPQRVISDGAFAKHGISDEMLRGMVTFKEIAPYLIQFLRRPGTWFVCHNAAFDIGVINRELERAGSDVVLPANRAICTLKMAASASTPSDLDSVCDALKIDRSRRQKHRALLDAELCAEVFRVLVFGARTADEQKAA